MTLSLWLLLLSQAAFPSTSDDPSKGVLVQIGWENPGPFTAWAQTGAIVQVLENDPAKVRAGREYLLEKNLLGAVSLRAYDGQTLPYIDNMVNFLVVTNPDTSPAKEEILRVLAPQGVAVVGDQEIVKPQPQKTDEWTHYTYGPHGTMVSRDLKVDVPRGLQWIGSPKWLRNHEFMASMHAMVSTDNKLFYIMDEGLRNHIFLPPHWVLIARDAYNGTTLWKRDLPDWHPHNWPMKSGPATMPRRLVAVGKKVFATMGYIQPVSMLDADTGETLSVFEDTKATEELIVSDGILYALVNPEMKPLKYVETIESWGKALKNANTTHGWSTQQPKRFILAVDTATGKVLWKHHNHVAPLSMVLGGQKLCFYDGTRMNALELKSGEPAWSTALNLKLGVATGPSMRTMTSEGVLVALSGTSVKALQIDIGEILWEAKVHSTGHQSPNDLFLINGLAWSLATGEAQITGTKVKALDLKTGETRKNFVAGNPLVYFMHQRCYPGKATEKYIMTSGTGTEFYEVNTEKDVAIHHHIRGSCIYGVMPANGLLYKPPDSCACHYQSKITHLSALHSEEPPGKVAEDKRLKKGPWYDECSASAAAATDDPWLTYRGSNDRRGSTSMQLTGNLKEAWSFNPGCAGGPPPKLSAVTAWNGLAFVAAVDQHTLYAIDAATGKSTWNYITGGRIDTPPTILPASSNEGEEKAEALCLFGCADGWIYCLRATDGALAWRYLAAPSDRQHVSCQQLESLWPLNGSVLVKNDAIYAVAGRNMFMDGGLRLVRLEPSTGKLLSEEVLNELHPETGKNLQEKMPNKAMPVANKDLLSCDDQFLYMGAQKFDFSGKRIDIDVLPHKEDIQYGEGRHLFSPTGLLDDLWFHRSYMIYGQTGGEGHGYYGYPQKHTQCGRMLVFTDDKIYAVRAGNVRDTMHPRTHHILYAANKKLTLKVPQKKAKKQKKKKKVYDLLTKDLDLPQAKNSSYTTLWQIEKPEVLAQAMVLAGDMLYLSGPPDLADESKMFGFLPGAEDDINRQLNTQDKAWKGQLGGLLYAYSAKDGNRTATYKLNHIPVWDGMAAADGRLFLSLQNGTLVCWTNESDKR